MLFPVLFHAAALRDASEMHTSFIQFGLSLPASICVSWKIVVVIQGLLLAIGLVTGHKPAHA